jgi:hypothetical protein
MIHIKKYSSLKDAPVVKYFDQDVVYNNLDNWTMFGFLFYSHFIAFLIYYWPHLSEQNRVFVCCSLSFFLVVRLWVFFFPVPLFRLNRYGHYVLNHVLSNWAAATPLDANSTYSGLVQLKATEDLRKVLIEILSAKQKTWYFGAYPSVTDPSLVFTRKVAHLKDKIMYKNCYYFVEDRTWVKSLPPFFIDLLIFCIIRDRLASFENLGNCEIEPILGWSLFAEGIIYFYCFHEAFRFMPKWYFEWGDSDRIEFPTDDVDDWIWK